MNPTYVWFDFTRQLRMPANMFFMIVLPMVMYIVFGAAQGYSSVTIGHGNVSAMMMGTMATYGAMTATTSLAGTAALEQQYGWRRQLALTPYTPVNFVVGKVAMAVMVAVLPILAIFTAGALGNAEVASWWRWLAIFGACLLTASVFTVYGLAIATWFRSEEAVGLASGLLVVLFFLGNAFLPLNDTMLAIGRFTPAYGAIGLARYPVTGGVVNETVTDPLWLLLLNMGVWAAIFVAAALLGARRSTGRQ